MLNTTGTVTQTAGISVTGSGSGLLLLLLGNGGVYTLTGSNNVTNLAVSTGTVNFNNGANALTIGTVAGTAGVTATNLYLNDASTVTQAAGAAGRISATNLLLAGGGSYTLTSASNVIGNLAGSTAAANIFNSSGTLTVTIVNGVTGLTAAGAVTLTSNALTISQALSASGQTVNLKGIANNTTIGLGSGGALTISQASLNNITAQNLLIGGTSNTGAISTRGTVTMPAGVTNLSLITTGAITIGSGSLTNNNANGSITLQTNANPTITGTLVANSTSGTVNILPIGTTTTIGLGTGTGTIGLTQAKLNQIAAFNLVIGGQTQTGAITVTNASGSPVTLSNVINLTLQTTGTISFSSAATSLVLTPNNGSITLLTNSSPTFTGTIRATGTNGRVTIATISDTGAIRVGASGTATIALTQASLNQITATTLVLGRLTATGAITVTSAITVAAGTFTNLSLQSGGAITVNSGASLTDNIANGTVRLQGSALTLTGAASVDSATGTLILDSAGSVSQIATISAAKLLLLNGSFVLTTAANSVGTLAANVAVLNYAQNGALGIGTVGSTAGVTSGSTVSIATGGNLTIASGSRVTAPGQIVLSAAGAFVNNQGSDAIASSGSRWLIYSINPGGDTFGNLESGNTAIWNATLATLPPASVSAAGNRYLFAFQPTVTFTSTNLTKTYGDDNSAAVTAAYNVSGIQNGVAGAFLGDTAGAVYSGTPSVTSAGVAGTADVAGSPYVISIAAGSVSSLARYALAFVSNGQLTVTQRSVTVTADSQNRVYGDANQALTYANTSLGAGVPLSGALDTVATATSDVGPYAITQGSITNVNNPNYLITYVGANLTVAPRPVTVTANAQSRTYGDANPPLTYANTSLGAGAPLNGALDTAANLSSNVGIYAITQGTLTNASNANYDISYVGANLTLTQATLVFTADLASRPSGSSNPTLTGIVTGLKNGETASLFGGDIWSSPADSSSLPGSYVISGSFAGLSPNYNLIQAASNATALTVTAGSTPNTNPSGSNPPAPGTPKNDVSISFQNPGSNLVAPVSFTPPPATNNVTTGGLPAGTPSGNSLSFAPISVFDGNQYSDFTVPDYAARATQAAVFTMIARSLDPQNAASYMINGFWGGASAVWKVGNELASKVSVASDLTPFGSDRNISDLLKNGPVIISNGAPTHVMLATGLTEDGKGIVANDPITGARVVLSFDAATQTVGGVVSLFDTATNRFVALADTGGTNPQGLAALQGFQPAGFLPVSVK